MGYHKNKIPKGVLGEVSKIDEEYLEFKDALETENPVMALVELSDLLGAIEAFSKKRHNLSLTDLLKMTEATKSAFEDGTRVDPRTVSNHNLSSIAYLAVPPPTTK
jgi:hypothetical protein